MNKFTRLQKIYSILQKAPISIEELYEWAQENEINISKRSLYRDLEDISKNLLVNGEFIEVVELEKKQKSI